MGLGASRYPPPEQAEVSVTGIAMFPVQATYDWPEVKPPLAQAIGWTLAVVEVD